MSERISVQWLPVVALDMKWESAFHKSLEAFDLAGDYIELCTSGRTPDLCVAAYPSVEHGFISRNNGLVEKLAVFSAAYPTRLVILACERARPKVSKRALSELLRNQVPPHFENQHSYLVLDPVEIEGILSQSLEITLRTRGLWTEYSASRNAEQNALSQPSWMEDMDDLWNQ